MKTKLNHLMALAAAVVVGVCFSNISAQAQGNFDPSEFRQRQLERYRENLDVKSEESWKKIEVLIGNVMDAQRAARMGAGFGFGFGRGGGRRGGDGNADQGRGNRNRLGQAVAETDALNKAIDDKASPDEIKAKLEKFREARKEKEMALEKAQEELRKALTPRQEASAVLAGLLK